MAISASVIFDREASTSELQRFEAVEPHMGTLVRVTIYTPDAESARRAFRVAFDRISELDRILSDYRPDSELNAVTARAVGQPMLVSADLLTVLRASQELAHATGGAFDITQGPVVRLWREARSTARAPDPVALKEAAGRSGFRMLHLNEERGTAMVDRPGMALDVGAIGKGYAASEAVEALARLGVRRALVAISGDLAFGDAPPGRTGWRIRIHSGGPSIPTVPDVLELSNAAVSTSGNIEQHLDVDGRRYSHVIDPSTGMGLTEDVAVTVIARHGLDADGLDTAISVIGTRRGLELIEARPGAAALVITRTDKGTTVLPSPRFLAIVERQSAASASR